jgi:hypothetical protein
MTIEIETFIPGTPPRVNLAALSQTTWEPAWEVNARKRSKKWKIFLLPFIMLIFTLEIL